MPYNFVPDSLHTAVIAEALRAKIDRQSAILHQRGQFDPKFLVQASPPTNNFCTDSYANECLTTLSLTVYTQLLQLGRYEGKDRKSAILHQRGHFDPKFLVQGVAPTNNFCTVS